MFVKIDVQTCPMGADQSHTIACPAQVYETVAPLTTL